MLSLNLRPITSHAALTDGEVTHALAHYSVDVLKQSWHATKKEGLSEMVLIDLLGSLFFIFLLAAWVWVLFRVMGDLLECSDLNCFQKALWVLVLIVPWLGVLIYLALNAERMGKQRERAAANAEDSRRRYIRDVAGRSVADELSKLTELRDRGVITDGEFQTQKDRLLN